jgi:hypothetical protein
MLLPQSSAFVSLRNRLNAVNSAGFLHIAPKSYDTIHLYLSRMILTTNSQISQSAFDTVQTRPRRNQVARPAPPLPDRPEQARESSSTSIRCGYYALLWIFSDDRKACRRGWEPTVHHFASCDAPKSHWGGTTTHCQRTSAECAIAFESEGEGTGWISTFCAESAEYSVHTGTGAEFEAASVGKYD